MEKMVKSLKPMTKRKSGKLERERKVLLGLVEYYLRSGDPVGSETLRQHAFPDLSSATLRNYFANLEEKGYLQQQHASGGRVPTDLAYRVYAEEYVAQSPLTEEDRQTLQACAQFDQPQVAFYLQRCADVLSKATQTAVFLSAPKFDQDFIVEIKLVSIDIKRLLAVIVTNFGAVRTDIFHLEEALSPILLPKIEAYCQARVRNQSAIPHSLTDEEQLFAKELYNELLMRYIVDYSNFSDQEVYRTGFSQLLSYKEFSDIAAFSAALALFEKGAALRRFLSETQAANQLKFWIGAQIEPYCQPTSNCSILAVQYRIQGKAVGAIGLMGPLRISYRRLFGILQGLSTVMSQALTLCLYKYKISYRQPEALNLQLKSPKLLEGHLNHEK